MFFKKTDDEVVINVDSNFTRLKNHMKRQKAGYIMGGIAIGIFALMQRSHRQFNEFLTEKGIDPNDYWLDD